MASPMQQFLETYMQVSQFQQRERAMQEQARQAGAAEALAMRQQENAEIGAFAQMASQVRNPAELTGLAEFFSKRSPNQAPVFQELARGIAPTMQVQRDQALYRMGPDYMQNALQVEQDMVLGASGRQRGEQFNQSFARGVFESDRAHGQSVQEFATRNRQWAAEFGQRQTEYRGTMDFNRAQLAQQGALGQMGIMGSAGMMPYMLRGQLSEEAEGIREVLRIQGGMMRPEARAGMERQLGDISDQMIRFDNAIAAEITGGGNAMTPGQMYENITAGLKGMESEDAMMRDIGARRYNMFAPRVGLPPVRWDESGWGGNFVDATTPPPPSFGRVNTADWMGNIR